MGLDKRGRGSIIGLRPLSGVKMNIASKIDSFLSDFHYGARDLPSVMEHRAALRNIRLYFFSDLEEFFPEFAEWKHG